MKIYRKIMQFFSKMGMRKPIQEGGYAELLRADKLGDVFVGNLIEIRDQVYLYRGMNKHGGPGQAHFAMMGYPTPYFGPATPQKENAITTFDIGSFPFWRKVGHRTPEEWKSMVGQLATSQ